MSARPRRRPDPQTSRAPQGLAARRGALSLLEAVLVRGRMLEGDRLDLPPPERAEALRLADLVLRRLGTLDTVLSDIVERAPPPPAREILRLLAAELLLAGTAPHAAVDIAVRLAKTGRGARQAGLINAVGRRLAAEGAERAAEVPPEVELPDWLAHRLVMDWGEAAAGAIAKAHLAPAPHDLTLRTPADAEALAAETGGSVLATGSLRLPGRPSLATLPGFEAGAWWLQDAAAALPVRLIPAPEGTRILDLCAAPGGKTMQLAALCAEVTALDISADRMARVEENLDRTGLTAKTVVADAFDWTPPAPFDAILLDAPCSATGTLRRHPDIARRAEPDVGSLAMLQDRLLARAWEWLAPGGTLVFCTCSLFKAEGETRIARFLDRTPEARLSPAANLPEELVTDGCLRTRPDLWADQGGIDGFFAAAVTRTA